MSIEKNSLKESHGPAGVLNSVTAEDIAAGSIVSHRAVIKNATSGKCTVALSLPTPIADSLKGIATAQEMGVEAYMEYVACQAVEALTHATAAQAAAVRLGFDRLSAGPFTSPGKSVIVFEIPDEAAVRLTTLATGQRVNFQRYIELLAFQVVDSNQHMVGLGEALLNSAPAPTAEDPLPKSPRLQRILDLDPTFLAGSERLKHPQKLKL